ncbi:putative pre-mRNA-splicing factor 38B [Plasmodium gaboni]|uniref:Putative pre-mRNA-splicing factor 38B n=1 Tax=Plasmodium gaboni TaxID=647221 RepID=A0A151L9P0_9APIC|nr:putative pre-mRNA-splicing factor 38B [Plasmodium gaboni]KYN95685.1 putative pre-mRNA-splicing factor 38B [Plasmodium gaboni]
MDKNNNTDNTTTCAPAEKNDSYQNDLNNKEVYNYYYYNNLNDGMGTNRIAYNNIPCENNYDGNRNIQNYYNYNYPYINNKDHVAYNTPGKYMMNYNYMDTGYYHMNNNNNMFNNTFNSFLNKTGDVISPYHAHNMYPNSQLALKYKLSTNTLSNNSIPTSNANYINDEKKNCLEMTNTTTYNVNTLLRNNILSSEYFKSLIPIKTFKEVLDEIHSYADHVEPYCIGSNRAPSTLFCCLYKFFTMHLSEKQLKSLIENKDSCYIRACGFLYLRYVHSPSNLWMWFEPYLLEEDEFSISADKRRKVTIGEYVQSLLSDDKYFNTVLPRLPIKIKNVYGARLMIIDDHRRRLKKNKENIAKFLKGEPVLAYINGEWEKGEIGGVVNHGKDKFFVRLREIDGNEKLVNIGYVKLEGKDKHKERDIQKHRSRDRSTSISERKRRRRRRNSSSRSNSRRRSRHSRSSSRRKRKRRHRYESRSSSRTRRRSHNRSHKRNSSHEKDYSIDKYSSRSHSRSKRRKHSSKHSSHYKSHNNHRDRSLDKYNNRPSEEHESYRSKKKRNESVSRSSSRSTRYRRDKYEKTEDELISRFKKLESQKALATGKDYARRPTSYKSSLSLKVDNIPIRRRSRSRSPRRIDNRVVVQVVHTDKTNNENNTSENLKLKELMKKYNKDDKNDELKMNNSNLEEMDIMTLG